MTSSLKLCLGPAGLSYGIVQDLSDTAATAHLTAGVPGVLAHATEDEVTAGALGAVVLLLQAGRAAAPAHHHILHLGQRLLTSQASCPAH